MAMKLQEMNTTINSEQKVLTSIQSCRTTYVIASTAPHYDVKPFFDAMEKIIGWGLIIASILWCENSTLCADQTKNDYTQLLGAPTELNISGMPISFNSYVYLNLMPRVIDSPKQTIDCAKEGQFIVQIRINSPSLPKDTSIGNV